MNGKAFFAAEAKAAVMGRSTRVQAQKGVERPWRAMRWLQVLGTGTGYGSWRRLWGCSLIPNSQAVPYLDTCT